MTWGHGAVLSAMLDPGPIGTKYLDVCFFLLITDHDVSAWIVSVVPRNNDCDNICFPGIAEN